MLGQTIPMNGCYVWNEPIDSRRSNLIYIKMLQYIYMKKLCTFCIPSKLLQMFHPLHFSSIQSSATVLAFVVSALAATQLAPQLRAVGADFPLPRLIAGKQQGIRMDQCIEWGTHGTGTYWYPILRPYGYGSKSMDLHGSVNHLTRSNRAIYLVAAAKAGGTGGCHQHLRVEPAKLEICTGKMRIQD